MVELFFCFSLILNIPALGEEEYKNIYLGGDIFSLGCWFMKEDSELHPKFVITGLKII